MVINHMCQENVELTYFLLHYTTVASDNKSTLYLSDFQYVFDCSWYPPAFLFYWMLIWVNLKKQILSSHELTFGLKIVLRCVEGLPTTDFQFGFNKVEFFHFITNYIVWCEWMTCRTTKSFQPESNCKSSFPLLWQITLFGLNWWPAGQLLKLIWF